MKYCIYCGASHDDKDQFCGECGRGIVEEQEHLAGGDYSNEVVYEDDDQYRVNLDYQDGQYNQGEIEYHDDEMYQQGVGYRGGEDYQSGIGYDETLYYQDGHGHQGNQHRGGYYNYQNEYYENRHQGIPGGDYYHNEAYHECRSAGKNTGKTRGGKGLIIALYLIVGLGLLGAVGYFVVYPTFFGDGGYSDDIHGEGENEENLANEEGDGNEDESNRRVQEVINAINLIDSETLTFEDRSVQGARDLFNALTVREQALVTNISRLEELEELVTYLIAEEEARILAGEERNKRFEVIETAMSWREAYQYAESRGGYLATVVNQEEFDRIATLAQGTDLRVIWLGGRRGDNNDFIWITGEVFTFSNWLPGEPTPPDGIENYLSMMWVDNQWQWVNVPNDVSDVYQDAWIGFVIAWDE